MPGDECTSQGGIWTWLSDGLFVLDGYVSMVVHSNVRKMTYTKYIIHSIIINILGLYSFACSTSSQAGRSTLRKHSMKHTPNHTPETYAETDLRNIPLRQKLPVRGRSFQDIQVTNAIYPISLNVLYRFMLIYTVFNIHLFRPVKLQCILPVCRASRSESLLVRYREARERIVTMKSLV